MPSVNTMGPLWASVPIFAKEIQQPRNKINELRQVGFVFNSRLCHNIIIKEKGASTFLMITPSVPKKLVIQSFKFYPKKHVIPLFGQSYGLIMDRKSIHTARNFLNWLIKVPKN